MAAQFSIRGKLFQMLKENAIWYGSFLVIIVILFIYIIAKGLLQWYVAVCNACMSERSVTTNIYAESV